MTFIIEKNASALPPKLNLLCEDARVRNMPGSSFVAISQFPPVWGAFLLRESQSPERRLAAILVAHLVNL